MNGLRSTEVQPFNQKGQRKPSLCILQINRLELIGAKGIAGLDVARLKAPIEPTLTLSTRAMSKTVRHHVSVRFVL